MNRIIRVAATLLAVAAIGATMSTTVSASSAVPTIVKSGQHWTVVAAKGRGCENEHFEAGHKFVADQLGDKGTWQEATMTTITLTWTGGLNTGTTFKATFKPASGQYKGTIKFVGQPKDSATLIPGPNGGC